MEVLCVRNIPATLIVAIVQKSNFESFPQIYRTCKFLKECCDQGFNQIQIYAPTILLSVRIDAERVLTPRNAISLKLKKIYYSFGYSERNILEHDYFDHDILKELISALKFFQLEQVRVTCSDVDRWRKPCSNKHTTKRTRELLDVFRSCRMSTRILGSCPMVLLEDTVRAFRPEILSLSCDPNVEVRYALISDCIRKETLRTIKTVRYICHDPENSISSAQFVLPHCKIAHLELKEVYWNDLFSFFGTLNEESCFNEEFDLIIHHEFEEALKLHKLSVYHDKHLTKEYTVIGSCSHIILDIFPRNDGTIFVVFYTNRKFLEVKQSVFKGKKVNKFKEFRELFHDFLEKVSGEHLTIEKFNSFMNPERVKEAETVKDFVHLYRTCKYVKEVCEQGSSKIRIPTPDVNMTVSINGGRMNNQLDLGPVRYLLPPIDTPIIHTENTPVIVRFIRETNPYYHPINRNSSFYQKVILEKGANLETLEKTVQDWRYFKLNRIQCLITETSLETEAALRRTEKLLKIFQNMEMSCTSMSTPVSHFLDFQILAFSPKKLELSSFDTIVTKVTVDQVVRQLTIRGIKHLDFFTRSIEASLPIIPHLAPYFRRISLDIQDTRSEDIVDFFRKIAEASCQVEDLLIIYHTDFDKTDEIHQLSAFHDDKFSKDSLFQEWNFYPILDIFPLADDSKFILFFSKQNPYPNPMYFIPVFKGKRVKKYEDFLKLYRQVLKPLRREVFAVNVERYMDQEKMNIIKQRFFQ